MGEAARRRNDDLVDDASEFELDVSARTIERITLAANRVQAAEEAANAAANVANAYRQQWLQSLQAVAEAAGYALPELCEVRIDAKANVITVYAKTRNERGEIVYVGDGPPDTQQPPVASNGHSKERVAD
jgi:hypothetical protein